MDLWDFHISDPEPSCSLVAGTEWPLIIVSLAQQTLHLYLCSAPPHTHTNTHSLWPEIPPRKRRLPVLDWRFIVQTDLHAPANCRFLLLLLLLFIYLSIYFSFLNFFWAASQLVRPSKLVSSIDSWESRCFPGCWAIPRVDCSKYWTLPSVRKWKLKEAFRFYEPFEESLAARDLIISLINNCWRHCLWLIGLSLSHQQVCQFL